VKSLLENLIEKMLIENGGEDIISSLELSSSPDHPLPCSADFHFFFSIAATAPHHSPDNNSFSNCGVTPPSSPPLSGTSPSKSWTSTPASPGVTLLPLSGQVTQAVLQVRDHKRDLQSEPPRKKVKMEALEYVNLLADVDISHEEEQGTDDEIPPLSLTFTTPADLLWKLQKADILPPNFVSSTEESCIGGGALDMVDAVDKEGEVIDDSIGHSIKVEEGEEDFFSGEVENNIPKNDNDMKVSRYPSPINEDDGEMKNVIYLNRPLSLSAVNLLHKPPRLGLSKLYRSSSSLHNVTIVETRERKMTYQKDLNIIEKEE